MSEKIRLMPDAPMSDKQAAMIDAEIAAAERRGEQRQLDECIALIETLQLNTRHDPTDAYRTGKIHGMGVAREALETWRRQRAQQAAQEDQPAKQPAIVHAPECELSQRLQVEIRLGKRPSDRKVIYRDRPPATFRCTCGAAQEDQ